MRTLLPPHGMAGVAVIPLPISLPDPALPCYATIYEAAHEALRQAIILGGDRIEAGGGIYRHGPLYCFTAPVTQNDAHGVDYRIGLVAPDRLVALYHSHPGSRRTGVLPNRLSDSDEALSLRIKLDMYIVAVEESIVLRYEPDSRRTSRIRF